MANVGSCVVLAGRACALGVERREVARVLGVAHVHATLTRKRRAHARRARGKHAVEHVDALAHRAHERGGIAHTHEIARTIVRQCARHLAQRLEHRLVVLAHRIAADAEATESAPARSQALVLDFAQTADALQAQVEVHAALHDAEERLIGSFVRRQATARPHSRQVDRALDELARRRVRRALVELHGDVGAKRFLDAHVLLGHPTHIAAVVNRAEGDAVVVELARIGEREDLEPARVGEHRPIVVHELVHPAGFRNHIFTGALRQMVGVRKHHLGFQLAKLRRGDALHRGRCADGHKHRSVEIAVRRREGERAGVAAFSVARAVEKRHASSRLPRSSQGHRRSEGRPPTLQTRPSLSASRPRAHGPEGP